MNTQIASETTSQTPERKSSRRKIEARVLTTKSEIEAALQLRYEVYFEELGRDGKFANHKKHVLKDGLDNEFAVYVGAFCPITKKMVGSCRLNFWEDGEIPENELYRFTDYLDVSDGRISLTSKMVVLAEYRGSTAFLEMAKELYRAAAARDCIFNFIATADHLVKIFERLGYRSHRPRTMWGNYGSSNPMIIDLGNVDHLEFVNSPFVSLAREYRNARVATARNFALRMNTFFQARLQIA